MGDEPPPPEDTKPDGRYRSFRQTDDPLQPEGFDPLQGQPPTQSQPAGKLPPRGTMPPPGGWVKDSSPPISDPSPRRDKPVDRWLALGSIAVGVALYLLPKTPAVVVISLALIFGLLFHPLWNFWWIDQHIWRRALGTIGLIAVLILLGKASWPELTGTQVPPLPTDAGHPKSVPPNAGDLTPAPQRATKPMPKAKTKDETPKQGDVNDKPTSRTGDITIGANSPVTRSTINTGTINYGPPKPFILTSEDQQKARAQLMVASGELCLICVGKGCQTANSLLPAFAGTEWRIQQVVIGTYSSISVGADGATVDAGAGTHLMEKEADANAVLALKSALESIGIKYELAPWRPFGGMPAVSGIILVVGSPE